MSQKSFKERVDRFTSLVVKVLLWSMGILGALLAVMLATGVAKVPEKAPVREAATAACAERDLQCWGDRGVVAAGIRCPRYVEAQALRSVRWTDSTFELKFPHFRWAKQGSGAMTFVGDRVEFQNGFGAFTPMTYECDMTGDGNRVLEVRVREGRLPL